MNTDTIETETQSVWAAWQATLTSASRASKRYHLEYRGNSYRDESVRMAALDVANKAKAEFGLKRLFQVAAEKYKQISQKDFVPKVDKKGQPLLG